MIFQFKIWELGISSHHSHILFISDENAEESWKYSAQFRWKTASFILKYTAAHFDIPHTKLDFTWLEDQTSKTVFC